MSHRNRVLALGLVALAAVGTPALAQRKEYRFGPVVGINFARLGGQDVSDAGTRTSFVAGIFSRSRISGDLGLETQVLWSEQGAKGELDDDIEGTIKLSYIKIPVLFTIAVPTSNARITPRFYLGPTVGFRTRCKVTGTVGGISASLDCEDAGLDTKSTEFSVLGGVGVDLGPVVLAARYDYGLSKIDDSIVGLDVKNRVFSLTAAYGIALNR
jgi:hypothetical protein